MRILPTCNDDDDDDDDDDKRMIHAFTRACGKDENICGRTNPSLGRVHVRRCRHTSATTQHDLRIIDT
jgi:hypothetical protein